MYVYMVWYVFPQSYENWDGYVTFSNVWDTGRDKLVSEESRSRRPRVDGGLDYSNHMMESLG